MLKGFSILFGTLFLGQWLSSALTLPVPGAIIGMLMLLIGLLVNGLGHELERTSTRLLGFMPVFILPASAGIVNYGALLKKEWVPLSLALTISLVVSFLLTPVFFKYFLRLFGGRDE